MTVDGFWLVIVFLEHLQIVTTSCYSAIANSHFAVHYSTHLTLLSLLCVHRLSGDSSNNVLLFSCSRSYRLATVSQLLTLNSTPLCSLNSSRSVQWYDLKAGSTENTVILLMWVTDHMIHYSGTFRPPGAWPRGNTASSSCPIVAWCHRRCDVFLSCECNHCCHYKLLTVP
jgi:hypothetical protein